MLDSPFALWLVSHPEFTLIGRDEDDPDDDDEDLEDDASDEDEDDEDEDEDEDDEDSPEALKKKLKDSEKARRKAERERDKAKASKPPVNEDEDDEDEDPEVKSLREENEGLRKLLNGPYIQSQIDSFKDDDGNPRWEWEDAETVYALLDRSDLEVDIETGEIDGLEEQLEDLAKSKGHFLLKKAKDDEDEENDKPKARRRRSSGRSPRKSNTSRKTDKLSEAELAREFNAIVQN